MKWLKEKRQCPNCKSNNTNQVSYNNFYCKKCFVEFNHKSDKVYEIMFDGQLVEIAINEFSNCV